MPKFSSTALQSKPWLWRYDDRRLRQCQYRGHSYRWFHMRYKDHHYYNGLCKQCDSIATYEVCETDHSLHMKLKKQFFKVEVTSITKEQSDQMIADHQFDKRKKQMRAGLDMRFKGKRVSSQGNSEPQK